MRSTVTLMFLFATGCVVHSQVTRDDDSDRIEREMTPEIFTPETPGATGIQLGPDAPPVAPPDLEPEPMAYVGRRHGGAHWAMPRQGQPIPPVRMIIRR